MKTFVNMTEAQESAQNFFKNNFGHKKGVGIESVNGNIFEFYSKDDPGMDDTYYCIIQN